MRILKFVFALWKANLLAAMEYRAAFLSQVIGMMLNNATYFVFWIIFFERFKQIQGWGLLDMFLLFAVVATSFGLAVFLFGNVMNLADIIANGRLDYYLSLPQPVLLHVLASASNSSGMGDFLYGILSFLVARQFTPDVILRFFLGVLFGATVFLSFLVIVQSLAFWMGNASMLAQQATNAIITFTLYPITLFDNTAKFFLFTLVPAALVSAIPASFIRTFSWQDFSILIAGSLIFFLLALLVFYQGLRRYESGSAFQVRV